MVRVINIRQAPPGWQSDKRYVYIGRPGQGLKGPLGNPFPVGLGFDRTSSIQAFSKYMRDSRNPEFVKALQAIKPDSILVCFCKPLACHGDLIAKRINEDPLGLI